MKREKWTAEELIDGIKYCGCRYVTGDSLNEVIENALAENFEDVDITWEIIE